MRIKNKKTGEIKKFKYLQADYVAPLILTVKNSEGKIEMSAYGSLAEFNKEWTDYEEPKEYYYIGIDGEIYKKEHEYFNEAQDSIGNRFKTKEEAEFTVEKLKAWNRLKDKGFRFDVAPALGHCDDEKFDISIIATMPAKWWYNDKVVGDIHYVFGGEE